MLKIVFCVLFGLTWAVPNETVKCADGKVCAVRCHFMTNTCSLECDVPCFSEECSYTKEKDILCPKWACVGKGGLSTAMVIVITTSVLIVAGGAIGFAAYFYKNPVCCGFALASTDVTIAEAEAETETERELLRQESEEGGEIQGFVNQSLE